MQGAPIGGDGSARRKRPTGRPCLGVSLCCLAAALAAGPVVGAQTFYRCDDGKGGVLYTDTRCRNATELEVVPGKADPAAIERLQREERAFAERQAAREARALEEARALREYRAARRQSEREALAYRFDPDWYYWGGLWPWPVVAIEPSPKPRGPRRDRRKTESFVPATPALGVPSPLPVKPAPPRIVAPPRPVMPAPRG
jgi:hypothetical protein